MLNDIPSAERIHITFFGKMNSGKSSLVNTLTNQNISIVSDTAGTTTDVVNKAMEIRGLGACVLVDTAGFDDISELGEKRILATEKALNKTDIAILLISEGEHETEIKWLNKIKQNNIPYLIVINKSDMTNVEKLKNQLQINSEILCTSIYDTKSIDNLKESLIKLSADIQPQRSITGQLANENDVIMLVMPQDIQAPKGRLILPQVQTIRELLDKKCIIISSTADKMAETLQSLAKPPKLIITDSQVFKDVYKLKPKESLLTSFSILFAAYKGDIEYYKNSAEIIDTLTENSKVLIAECCTHSPTDEDIGRVKLPKLLRKKAGESLTVDIVGGADFPENLTEYDLIIQCGACMFNRNHVMSRINKAKNQAVPMTNYGVAIAHLNGILDKITIEGE